MIKKIKSFLYFTGKEFKSDVKDFTLITNEKADFVYQASLEYLRSTQDSLRILHSRVVLILGFIFSLLAFSLPKIFQLKTLCQLDFLDQQFVFFLLLLMPNYFLIALVLIIYVLVPKSIAVPGNKPKNLISQNLLNEEISVIKLRESENYQRRINFNLHLVNKINFFTKYSLVYMILSLLLCVFVVFCFGKQIMYAICY